LCNSVQRTQVMFFFTIQLCATNELFIIGYYYVGNYHNWKLRTLRIISIWLVIIQFDPCELYLVQYGTWCVLFHQTETTYSSAVYTECDFRLVAPFPQALRFEPTDALYRATHAISTGIRNSLMVYMYAVLCWPNEIKCLWKSRGSRNKRVSGFRPLAWVRTIPVKSCDKSQIAFGENRPSLLQPIKSVSAAPSVSAPSADTRHFLPLNEQHHMYRIHVDLFAFWDGPLPLLLNNGWVKLTKDIYNRKDGS
jgi:hypothetical protein